MDSTRGMMKRLVEQRCMDAKIAVRKFMQKVSTEILVRQYALNPDSYIALRKEPGHRLDAQLSSQYVKADGKAMSQQHGKRFRLYER